MDNRSDAIFYPVFRGAQYLHHTCSECGHEIVLSQSPYGGVSFYEFSFGTSDKIKFCPHCGGCVARFDTTPRFEKCIDYTPLDIFSEERERYERKCRWLYHCYISENHRGAIDALLKMIESDKNVSGFYRDASRAAELGKKYKANHHEVKKLIAEFGTVKEATP